ncbi:MAG: gamma-glutamyl hercynylcysteine S-oxide synthase [Solirubrobacterales bacterium]|nr:gamma-glutamyl hercynylcysteine S-oxide synthase [Solirubrobacterales bacterium]
MKEGIAERLADAREMTLLLIEPLSEEQLNRVYSPILSPLIWDLGHIANFEELWLVREIGGRDPLHGELGDLYDAIEQPRKIRGELPILKGDEVRPYLEGVRERTLEVLDELDLSSDNDNRLLRDGFVYEMILAHEHQHNETMLQLLQLVDDYEPAKVVATGESASEGPEMVPVAGGSHEIGAADAGYAYDNERPRHTIELAAFEIDRTPVTNGDWISFMEDTGTEPPMYWEADGEGGWTRNAMGRNEAVDPSLPVIHVSWHEADAFANWAGKRLPTEPEWEAAAAGADRERANLDLLSFGGAPAGAYADAPSDCGAVQMLGDVWEWTSSDFTAYPGFEAFPYPEYSEVFFGDTYKVLRGGAWATRRSVVRNSFRNWDLPERRQIFAGLRCARNIDP